MIFDENYSLSKKPIVKAVRKLQGPLSNVERIAIKGKPYAAAVGSLKYVQTCTCPNLSFVTIYLGRYQSDLGLTH